MRVSFFGFILLAAVTGFVIPATAGADAYNINFDTVVNNVAGSAIWPVVEQYEVLPAGFSLAPATCDINGGFDISQTPIILFPNEMLDSDEYALVSAILASPSFDATATGGTSHELVHAAWTQNFAQAWRDLGGGVGGPEVLLPPGTMIPDIEYFFTVLMTIGDQDTMAFPMLIMDLVVNDNTVRAIIGDPNLRVPDPGAYQLLYPYLGWCGDADGDGCSNLNEYLHFKPLGGRNAYIAAAMDPAQTPPGCSGDRICDGTGGLLGEYFGTRFMTNLVAERIDPQVSFDWGGGQPHPDIAANDFSVCWTGFVTPEYSEAYTFSVRTDDGVRLWVNNELLVNEWSDHGATTYSGTTSTVLTAGQPYPIRMDFYEKGGDAVAWLGWESASQTRKAIYEMNLTPGKGIGDRALTWIRNPANGHFYKLAGPMTWTDGNTTAGEWGGYLATINDAAENLWIQTMFGPAADTIFIGANDIAQEGRWVWAENGDNFWNGNQSGTPVPPNYANWADGEPNDASGEDAGMIYSGSAKWNDLNVTRVHYCLVETGTGQINYTGPSPQTAILREGWNYILRVEARYTHGNVGYQWKKDGAVIDGATEPTLTVSKVGPLNAGAYTCVITDESPATVETKAANLTVIDSANLPAAGGAALFALAAALALAGARRRGR